MASESFTVRVPGSTSNLGSGFDTLSAALSTYLRLSVSPTGSKTIQWPADWHLPSDQNMIEKAFCAAAAELGIRPYGIRFDVKNEIPLKRGLGSSGAAIIGGIKVAERIAGKKLDIGRVFELAYPLERHPDNIAASLLGGWVISRVSGEGMAAERLESKVRCRFVVAIPEKFVSTAKARGILPEHYGLSDAVFNLQRVALLVHALSSGSGSLLEEATRDRLHQSYRANLVPGLPELLEKKGLPEEATRSLLSVTLSGSGSSVLSIATGDFDLIGRWMVESLEAQGVRAAFKILDLDPSGARIIGPSQT